MLRYLYGEYLRRGGFGRFSDFMENRSVGSDLNLRSLDYDTLVELLHELFGKEGVRVIPFELVSHDREMFYAEVASFVGIQAQTLESLKMAPPLSAGARAMLRASNRLFRRSELNPTPRMALPWAVRIRDLVYRVDARVVRRTSGGLNRADEELIRQIIPRYATGNARLERLTGVSLAPYGYPLPQSAASGLTNSA